jgi:hypothetical protein
MTILNVILILNILLALDMVSRHFSKVTWKEVKKTWKNAWYYICFWKPLRRWVWSKIPKIPNEKWEELSLKSFQKVIDTPEKKEIIDFYLPYFKDIEYWTPEEKEIGEKRKRLIDQVKYEQRIFENQYIMETQPWTRILFKIKFLN